MSVALIFAARLRPSGRVTDSELDEATRCHTVTMRPLAATTVPEMVAVTVPGSASKTGPGPVTSTDRTVGPTLLAAASTTACWSRGVPLTTDWAPAVGVAAPAMEVAVTTGDPVACGADGEGARAATVPMEASSATARHTVRIAGQEGRDAGLPPPAGPLANGRCGGGGGPWIQSCIDGAYDLRAPPANSGLRLARTEAHPFVAFAQRLGCDRGKALGACAQHLLDVTGPRLQVRPPRPGRGEVGEDPVRKQPFGVDAARARGAFSVPDGLVVIAEEAVQLADVADLRAPRLRPAGCAAYR